MMAGADIVILAAEGIIGIGLLTGIIIFTKKLKRLREQKKLQYEQLQKNTLDEMLKNERRR